MNNKRRGFFKLMGAVLATPMIASVPQEQPQLIKNETSGVEPMNPFEFYGGHKGFDDYARKEISDPEDLTKYITIIEKNDVKTFHINSDVIFSGMVFYSWMYRRYEEFENITEVFPIIRHTNNIWELTDNFRLSEDLMTSMKYVTILDSKNELIFTTGWLVGDGENDKFYIIRNGLRFRVYDRFYTAFPGDKLEFDKWDPFEKEWVTTDAMKYIGISEIKDSKFPLMGIPIT